MRRCCRGIRDGKWLTRSAASYALVLGVLAWLTAPADAWGRKHKKTDPEDAEAELLGGPVGDADAEPKDEAPAKKKKKRKAAEEEAAADGEGDDQPSVRKRAAAEEEPSEAPGRTGLELGVGAMALFRQLAWTSDADKAGLGPYSLTPGPEAGVWLEFYPAAFATDGFAGNIGLYARYDYGFGVTTKTQGDGDVATKYEGFVGGLKLRLPLGTFTPFATVGYGNQQFRLTAAGTPRDIPAFDYSFVRIGAGTRVQFTPGVALDVNGAFLAVTDPGSAPGQVASAAFFPRAKAYAIDFGASVYVHLTSAIGVRGGLDWRQYGLAFYPRTGDPASRMVTGATDRYIVTWAGLEVLLERGGGKLEAPSADDEEN